MRVAGAACLLIAELFACVADPSTPLGASSRAPELVPNLSAAGDAASKLPRLRSLLVSWRGSVVLERYYNGASRDRLANIKSASKSVISTLVGIALDRKLIPDLKTPIVTFFPELARDRDPGKREITVEDLLTMRSGLEGTSNRNYGAWVTSRNWVQWPRDPQGIYFGGNDMLMTPRQMLAFGELFRNKGRAGGQQVVASRWVERSCDGRARSPRPWNGTLDPMRDRKYGYGWWVYEIGGYETCFAWGYGGQYVFVLPELDLVLVTTSSPDVSEERRGHRQVVFDILDRLVGAPISRASGS